MGRKKKNARHSVHGRKIHVNKYINQCGKTKKCRKSAVSWRPASKETPFNDMPTYQWPTVRTPKQYEVWFAELGDHSGTSVQSGTRPVLVISNDVANRNSPVITVIPLSSKLKKLELPVHIVLTEKECEMLRDEHLEDSILLVEQITTIDKLVLFNRFCCVVSVQKKHEIEAAVTKQFAMRASTHGANSTRKEAELKTSCRFCVWKFEKRNGQKTKMPYNPANGDRARINDLRTFADFKTTLVTYAMGGYDGIGIAVGSGIGAFDIDHCIREDGTLNDTADTVLSIFPTAYVEKSPSGKGLRGFFHVPEDYVYDKTVYYINNRSKGLEVYMPGATNRFVTVTGDVYRTGEIPNDETAMTTLLDTLMKRNKQVQQTHFQHHSYLDDEAVIAHANEASNSEKFKKLFAGEWEDLYGSQSDADMALLSILAFWCGCDEEQMDRIFRTSGLMRPK